MEKNTNKPTTRNVTAMHMKLTSKQFAHKNDRRAKDVRKSWRREEY